MGMAMDRAVEDTYRYSRFQKIVQSGFLVAFSFMSVVMLGLLFVGELKPGGIVPFFATILGLAFLPFMAVVINMLTPDIRVREEGFRLITTVYQSHWVGWDEIRSIERIKRVPGTCYGIGTDQISSVYSVVGYMYGLGGRKVFLIWSRIDKFNELIGRLEMHRPDLFADQQ